MIVGPIAHPSYVTLATMAELLTKKTNPTIFYLKSQEKQRLTAWIIQEKS